MHISNWLRKLGLLRMVDGLRFYLYKKSKRSINREFVRQHSELVLPPPYFIYETYQLDYERYYNDGKVTAAEIIDHIKKFTPPLKAGFQILDWGCGPGRITRHLPDYLPPGSQVYGSDYNEKYIQWCKENIPNIHWTTNSIDPPLPFSGNSFDAIIGLSVFTHLGESNLDKWLGELHRISKKKGIVFLTTQGAAFRNKLTSTERRQFDSGSIVAREKILEGHRLYSAFHPVECLLKRIEPRFQVVELLEGSKLQELQPAQDVWILKKRDLNG